MDHLVTAFKSWKGNICSSDDCWNSLTTQFLHSPKKHKNYNEMYNESLYLNGVINIVSKKMGFDIKTKITEGLLIK